MSDLLDFLASLAVNFGSSGSNLSHTSNKSSQKKSAPPKAATIKKSVPLKAANIPQGKNNASRGFRSELSDKIKKNPWKTLGTTLLATVFPVGTVIAGVIATGVVTKSAVDARSNKPPTKTAASHQGKIDAPRGFRSELANKIKNNPWKTLGTALLATAFPVGTVIAGVIATGVVTKSAVDARSNKPPTKTAASHQGKIDAPRGFRSELGTVTK